MTAVPGKCHFDSTGRLRGPINITHYLSPNRYPSGFAEHARGLVQHTEDGFTAGTVATFLSPAAKVSAFFGVGEDGAAQQFLPLGQGYQAWAQGAGNQAWRSCECEDKTRTGQPMTDPQIVAFAQILEACSAYDGFPLEITDDPQNGTGLITHGAGGEQWGDHPQCPGDVRKAQRPVILALAKSIRAGGSNVIKTASGRESLHQIAGAAGIGASHLLRLTAITEGSFDPGLADYINGVFAATTPPGAPVPAGCRFWVPPSA
jgi:N-acetylmuramoyl-L-alanine amidase